MKNIFFFVLYNYPIVLLRKNGIGVRDPDGGGKEEKRKENPSHLK